MANENYDPAQFLANLLQAFRSAQPVRVAA